MGFLAAVALLPKFFNFDSVALQLILVINLFIQSIIFQVLLLTGFDSLVSCVSCLRSMGQNWLYWLIWMELRIELVFEKWVSETGERQLLAFCFTVWQV